MARTVSDLRLLYVIDSLAPGGAERSLAALAPHYRRLGIALEVVALAEREGLRDDIEGAGGRVTAVVSDGRAGRLREVSTLIGARRPTLVHTTLFESDVIGRVAARRHHIPVVSSLVSEAYGPEHRGEMEVHASRLLGAQLVDAVTARLAVRAHAVSYRVKSVMSQRLHYPESRIDVVHRGRDPATLGPRTPERRAQARSLLGLGDDETMVLAVSRHEPSKALDTLVAAFAQVQDAIPNSRLFIAGKEGNATEAIRKAVRMNGIDRRVALLGPRDDVADLLCATDLFVLPSVREGLPGAVIEAMAMQAPVVASRIPQVVEVTGENGAVLAAPGDPDDLASGILQVVTGGELTRKRVEVAARRFSDSFTIERSAQGMLTFYERSLQRDKVITA